jgi:hypothetical protein
MFAEGPAWWGAGTHDGLATENIWLTRKRERGASRCLELVVVQSIEKTVVRYN